MSPPFNYCGDPRQDSPSRELILGGPQIPAQKCTSERLPEVAAALGKFNVTISALADAVKALSKRLEPALRPETPNEPCDKKLSPDVPASALARAIRDRTERIESQTDLIRSIINRLEL
jgi:hypothetical protein